MGNYRRRWEFDEPFRPRDTSMQEFIDFANWKDEMLKKKEEQDKHKAFEQQKKKHPAKEWSKKEIAMTMFLTSPLIGIPVALIYIQAFKTMIHIMQTLTP